MGVFRRPENYFEPFLTNPGSVMRVLHYPPQFGVIDAREIGIGAHRCASPSSFPERTPDTILRTQ